MKKRHRYLVCILTAGLLQLPAGCSREAKSDHHLKRADAFYQAGNYPAAVIDYMNVLKYTPDNETAIRMLGFSQYELGYIQQAYPLLRQIHQAHPDDLEVRLKLAGIYLVGGQSDQAWEQASVVLEKEPDNLEALVMLSGAAQTTERSDRILARLKEGESKWSGEEKYHLALGRMLLLRKDVDGASAAFNQAVATAPDSITAHIALGDFRLGKGELAGAEKAYKTAFEKSDPDSMAGIKWASFNLRQGRVAEAKTILNDITAVNPKYVPAWHLLAEIALAEKDYAACVQAVGRVVKINPSHLQARLLQARARVAAGEIEKALAELKELSRTVPGHPLVDYQYALVLARTGDLTGASDHLRVLLKAHPNHSQAAMLLAQLYLRAGAANEAQSLLEDWVDKHPDLPDAHLLLGAAYRKRGQLDEAAGAYRRFKALVPRNAQAPYLLGLVSQAQGNREEAVKAFEECLALKPDHLRALAQLASMDLAEDRKESAFERVRKQVAKTPDSAGLNYLLGSMYLRENELEKAEQVFQKTLDLEPGHTASYIALSQIYNAQGKEDEALAKMEESLKIRPEDQAALMLVGTLYQRRGDLTRAQEYYEKLFALNPGFAPAANNLAYIYSEHLQDYDKAFKMVQKARDLAPNDPSVADTFGWILYHRGEYQWARGLLEESVNALSENPEVMYHLGMTRCRLGEDASAADLLERALALSGEFRGADQAARYLEMLKVDPEKEIDESTRAMLDRMLADFPGDPATQVRLAAMQVRRGDIEPARKMYEDVVQRNPAYYPAQIRLAQLYAKHLADYGKALELVREVRKQRPEDPVVADLTGWMAYLNKDYKWALSLLRESVEKQPDQPAPQYRLGRVNFMLGRVDQAAEAAKLALALDDGFNEVDECKTFLSMIQPDTEQDLASVERVLADDPGNLSALYAKALIHQQQGDASKAMAQYALILKRHPSFAEATHQMAIYYEGQPGTENKAFELSMTARDQLPDDPSVAGVLGKLVCRRGQYRWASQLLKESIAALPNDPEMHYYLGICHDELDQPPEAVEAFTKALALEGNFRFADSARKRLEALGGVKEKE